MRALADAAMAEIPVTVDSREVDFENGAYAAGVTHDALARYVTSEQVVEEREQESPVGVYFAADVVSRSALAF